MKTTAIVFLLMLAPEASARTLWSGSFVAIDGEASRIRVSVNYPARGPGKICGIELKSQTMILNRRV